MTNLQQEDEISITKASFWNIIKAGRAGEGALRLYILYCHQAYLQNTIQPRATDSYCATRLLVARRSVIKWRALLVSLGMVEHIIKYHKGKRYHYLKVNYLTRKIEGTAKHHMGEEMTEAECNTYIAFDFYATWFEGFRDSERFAKDVAGEFGGPVVLADLTEATGIVWERINTKGYGISSVRTQFQFYTYMVASAVNELRAMSKGRKGVRRQPAVIAADNGHAQVIVWPSFEDFWIAYGKNVDRVKCEAKWKKISQGAREKIMEHVAAYVQSTPDVQYRKNPATYLNNESWNNEIVKNGNTAKTITRDDRNRYIDAKYGTAATAG